MSIEENDSAIQSPHTPVLRRTVEDAGLITRGFSQRPEGKLTAGSFQFETDVALGTHAFQRSKPSAERDFHHLARWTTTVAGGHDAPVGNVYRAVMVGEP